MVSLFLTLYYFKLVSKFINLKDYIQFIFFIIAQTMEHVKGRKDISKGRPGSKQDEFTGNKDMVFQLLHQGLDMEEHLDILLILELLMDKQLSLQYMMYVY